MTSVHVATILAAVKELISTSSTAGGNQSTRTSGLSRSLQTNLKSYREWINKDAINCLNLRSRVLHFKDTYKMGSDDCADHSRSMKLSGTHSTYLEFVPEGLSLLLVLNETLHTLHEEDKRSPAPEERGVQPLAPKSLLSISDQKAVHSLVQFVVSLGVFPYLIPPLDGLLLMRLGHAKMVEKCSKATSSDERAQNLYKSCRVLVQCFENPVLGPNLISQHLSDVLVALLQICYAPREGSVEKTDSRPESVSEREWCTSALHKLLSKTYQPLVVRELLAIQRISSVRVTPTAKGAVQWLQRICGRLLSERLMHKNGVQHVLRGIFEATVTASSSAGDSSSDWNKCQAVAKIIASCPAGVSNMEEYYSLICPQVLGLFRLPKDGVGRQFLRVAVATVSAMMSKQRELGMRYLFRSLMRPLLQLAGEEGVAREGLRELSEALERCVDDLHRICSIVEPSSMLVNATLPYLPLIFDLWRITKSTESDFSSKCREVVLRILKPSSSTAIVTFLKFVSGIRDHDCDELCLKQLHPGFSLTLAKDPHRKLVVEPQSDLLALQSLDSSRMESVGNCVLNLIQCDFKLSPIPGMLFLQCLNHLSSQLCQTAGYTPPSLSPSQLSSHHATASKETVKEPSLSTSSTLLLACEETSHGPSHSQAYHNALVLYVTAALCEHMSSDILQSISEVRLLLEAVLVIVCSHAHFVSEARGIGDGSSLLLVAAASPDLEELPGGSISLSIVFGLLSAILGGEREVARADRPLLNSLLSPLEVIASRYPDPELASLASDLRVCMATLGVVWSEEMREKAAEMKSEGSFTKKIKSAAKHSRPGENDRTQSAKGERMTVSHNPSQDEKEVNEYKTKSPVQIKRDAESAQAEVEVKDSFHQALIDVADPLVPVSGHGLISLTRLIEAKDKETLANIDRVFLLFQKHINHPDTYIYLAAINGLVALASFCSTQRDQVIATLCEEYALLSGPPSRGAAAKVDVETGQLKTSDSSVTSSGKEGTVQRSKSPELRMKLGEALVRIVRESNELLPRYMEQVMAAILVNVRDPDPLVRASSLSNLAEVSSLAKFSLTPFQNEVLSCVRHVLESDREVKVRQGAIVVLKLLIKGLSHDAIQVLGDSLLDIYRLLKQVEGSERDEVTRAHAQAALGELDTAMREFIFPEPNLRPHKKITILN